MVTCVITVAPDPVLDRIVVSLMGEQWSPHTAPASTARETLCLSVTGRESCPTARAVK